MLKYIAMALVAFVTVVNAEVIEPYGFGSVSVPTGGDGEYALRWLRPGTQIHPSDWMRVHLEYDVATTKLSYGYAEVVATLFGMRIAGSTGQMLSPIAALYPGPATLPLTRWPDTLASYALRNTGVAGAVSGKGWKITISHYADHQIATCATYQGVSLFWQKGVGGGVITRPIRIHHYLQPSAGVSVETVETVAFVQNRATITPWLNAYVQADYHSAENGVAILSGLTATYAPRSFIKLLWDGKEEKLKSEITFAF